MLFLPLCIPSNFIYSFGKDSKNSAGFNVSLDFVQHPSFPQHLIQCLTKGPRGWTNIAPGKTQCERDLYVHV